LDSSIRASHNGSILAVTATDLAPLCGVNPLACKRKYGGIPLRVEYCHEVALRLVIGSIARTAGVHEFGIEPIFAFYSDHYLRVYLRLMRGARNADESIKKLGLIYHCPKCGERKKAYESITPSILCEYCGNMMHKGGPMWIGEYANASFCDKMLSIIEKSDFLNKATIKIVNLVKNEVGLPPTFYNIDKLSGSIGKASIPTRELFETVIERGYNIVRTHFDPRGFKTEAPLSEIRKLLKD
jgi:tRNA (guanine26-N2/guanine27-N2)-dimethyltransferase